MKVGIIGFGRLGGLLTKYLSQDSSVYVYDEEDKTEGIKAAGGIPSTLEEACNAAIVIPMVPISAFEEVIIQIKNLLKPHSLVVDVCSVKVKPVQAMLSHLPENISILGTHPMFGPDSADKTLFGSKIVLSRVRIEDKAYDDIKNYLEDHGIKVIEATPEQHDKEISSSLVLTHFIGRALMDFGAEPLMIETKGYRRLMKILQTVENDSWQLFEDMNGFNGFANETRERFLESLENVNERLK
jgi:prephenate dehydrogenase